MAELADALDLESDGKPCKFKSCRPYQKACNSYLHVFSFASIFGQLRIAAILSFFEFIADENNYPIIFHCSIGTDRTGFFAFLVNGLLGVRQEDLYRDYLFSNFSNIGSRRTAGNISSYVNTIQTYQGSTLSERIENCLISIGVSKKHLDSVRKIMLG